MILREGHINWVISQADHVSPLFFSFTLNHNPVFVALSRAYEYFDARFYFVYAGGKQDT